MSNREINRLIQNLQMSFDGTTWYGESLMGKLNKIDAVLVNNSPFNTTNSIAKLLQHIINWRIFAIEKLKGNEAFDIELNSKEDWPETFVPSLLHWESLKEELKETQKRLIALLISKSDDFLEIKTPGRTYNYRFLVEGVIQHDIYHLGQIGIVAKQALCSKKEEEHKTKTAVDVFDNCAVEYQERFMDLTLYQDSLDLFCQLIERQEPSILELACGPGNVTQYLLGKRADFKILATDLAPKMLELAKKNNPKAIFKLFNSKNIDQLDQKFDAIIAGFLLPYLSKEELKGWIYKLPKILEENGLVYLSTMEDAYHKSGWRGSSSNPEQRAYIHYHEADYIIKYLEDNKFKILDLSRKKTIDHNEKEVIDLLIIAQK